MTFNGVLCLCNEQQSMGLLNDQSLCCFMIGSNTNITIATQQYCNSVLINPSVGVGLQ